ncbi:hypothetical protein [Pseudomonas fluorescens]|uniref:Morphogenetic protein n=1 Tax=Pseudomonas fluorescens TaxID=294 RepID=A0A944DSJ1_PSEFL|nr:hypothetical protein [Pseudomonas fluorescens]MBT2295713.1 hypothetical protein [Pseudomonas fluorescens]MBT2305970.1 hypothetical protein [Pseudomonas fluorescens]MBT2314673.1 hypothetical protein [Pseudomonas fluorescens]MBT2315578.1 hypothetical protein [Pseudomonas fluorescens]MBT2331415.1 hypothetical protein [Pseudomonas fluorescens]
MDASPQPKERPILFSAPMVRAILEGGKTVTRRPVKGLKTDNPVVEAADGTPLRTGACWDIGGPVIHCPYGKPGDRLWVREAWVADAQVNAVAPRDLSQGEPILYPANVAVRQTGCSMIMPGKTRPSIHMPRWVSRILLEITDVRVERLQDISDEQAQAEGCFFTDYGRKCGHGGNGWREVGDCPAPEEYHPQRDGWMWDKTTSSSQCLGAPRWAFANLWNSVNGPDAWDDNPRVWVVEFKRVQP